MDQLIDFLVTHPNVKPRDLPFLSKLVVQGAKEKPQIHEVLSQFGWNPTDSTFRQLIANTSVVLQAILDMPEAAPMQTVKPVKSKPAQSNNDRAATITIPTTSAATPKPTYTPEPSQSASNIKDAARMFAQLLDHHGGIINSAQIGQHWKQLFGTPFKPSDYGPYSRLKEVLAEIPEAARLDRHPTGRINIVSGTSNTSMSKPRTLTSTQPATPRVYKCRPLPPNLPPNGRFKLCSNWPDCSYGSTCFFAHGDEELQEWTERLRLNRDSNDPSKFPYWDCMNEACGSRNYSHRTICHKCGYPAPAGKIAPLAHVPTPLAEEMAFQIKAKSITEVLEPKNQLNLSIQPPADKPHVKPMPDRIGGVPSDGSVTWTVRIDCPANQRMFRYGLLYPSRPGWNIDSGYLIDYNYQHVQRKLMQFKPNKQHEYRPEITIGPHPNFSERGRFVEINVTFKATGNATRTINWLVFDFKTFSVGKQLGVEVIASTKAELSAAQNNKVTADLVEKVNNLRLTVNDVTTAVHNKLNVNTLLPDRPLLTHLINGGVAPLVVKKLIEAGADVDVRNGTGQTALHVAAMDHQDEIAQILLDAGAQVDVKDSEGWTPIQLAGINMNWSTLQVIIVSLQLSTAGADINRLDPDGLTIVHRAACCGDVNILAYMLQLGADKFKPDANGRLPVAHAVRNPDTTALVQLRPVFGDAAVDAALGELLAEKTKSSVALAEQKAQAESVPAPMVNESASHAALGNDLMDMLEQTDDTSSSAEPSASITGSSQLASATEVALGMAVDSVRWSSEPMSSVGPPVSTAERNIPSAQSSSVFSSPGIQAGITPFTNPLAFDLPSIPASNGLSATVPNPVAMQDGAAGLTALAPLPDWNTGSLEPPTAPATSIASLWGNNASTLTTTSSSTVASNTMASTTIVSTTMASNTTVGSGANMTVGRATRSRFAAMMSQDADASAPPPLVDPSGPPPLVDPTGPPPLVNDGALPSLWAPPPVNAEQLQHMVATSDVDALRNALATGANSDVKDEQGQSLLHAATEKNSLGCLSVLLQHGAQVDATNRSGETIAHRAVLCQHLQVLDKIQELRPQEYVPLLRKVDYHGQTALHYAIALGSEELVNRFIREVPDLLIVADDKGNAALLHALVQNQPPLRCIELLLKLNCNTHAVNNAQQTPLQLAFERRLEPVAQMLIAHGAARGYTDAAGNTALHLAAKYQAVNIATLLLEQGAEVDRKNSNGQRPIDLAMINNDQNLRNILHRYEDKCAGCLKRRGYLGTKLNACSGCMSRFYCSQQCQVADWQRQHSKECAQLKMQYQQAQAAGYN
eukprot:TRINITY_DN10849_c0_g1_i2.p1 TRINITY_DN10849_c0_g1~~TRINITY_DN10849_c0_g1_i2.p1  ORF type:complete len:1316 (+),score=305.33 TRINITY_DN10849_c0_g1_i2:29-3976(+)